MLNYLLSIVPHVLTPCYQYSNYLYIDDETRDLESFNCARPIRFNIAARLTDIGHVCNITVKHFVSFAAAIEIQAPRTQY